MYKGLQASPSAGNYGEQMTRPMRGVGSEAVSFAGQAARAAAPHVAAGFAQAASKIVEGVDPLTSLGNLAVPERNRKEAERGFAAGKSSIPRYTGHLGQLHRLTVPPTFSPGMPAASWLLKSPDVAEATRGAGSSSGSGGGGGSLLGLQSTIPRFSLEMRYDPEQHRLREQAQKEAEKLSRQYERLNSNRSRKVNKNTGRPRSRGRSRNRHNRERAAARSRSRSRRRYNRSRAARRSGSRSRNRDNTGDKMISIIEKLRREQEYPGYKGRFKKDGTPHATNWRIWQERQEKR